MPTGAQATANSSPLSVGVAAVIILLVAVPSSHAALESQGDILRRFKASLTNADPALADWNIPANPPCVGNVAKWKGVSCFNGYVWGVTLDNLYIGGRIDVDSLSQLRFLRILSLKGNTFEGRMPDWRKLGSLKSLDLSNNKFSGEIPDDAFEGMPFLKKVYLDNNEFTGKIPSSLESGKFVEVVLSDNQFTGEIPEFNSDGTKIYNVSNNQLLGPVPNSLQKLDPSSFSGNQGLCGKPLEASCSPSTAENSSTGIIIAVIVFALLLIIVLIIICLCKRKKPAPEQDEGVMALPQNTKAAAPPPEAATLAAGSSDLAAGKKSQQQGNSAGKLTFVKEEDRNKFDLQDLMRASAEVLGSGTFGASYKAVMVDGEALVVKRFKMMNNVAKEDFHEHMRRLGRLKHPNLLPLVAYLYRREEKLLVFDHINNGSLAQHLYAKHSEEEPGLSWQVRLKIIKGVAKGIMYLHNELPSLTLPHGHLKSANVLVDDNFNPLLMDYTLVPVVNSNQVHQVLVAYKSPEYTKTYRVTKKTDVWCLGLLILEILTGRYMIAQGSGHKSTDLSRWIQGIAQEASTDPTTAFDKDMKLSSESCKSEVEKLLRIGIACCEEDVDKRPSMEEAVKQIEQVQELSVL